MTDLQQLIEQLRPEEAAQLQAALDQRAAEPAKPATLLDELRAEEFDAAGAVAVSDVPNAHEVPILLGLLCRRVQELEAHVNFEPADEAAESPGEASQVVTPAPADSPAPVPAAAPAPVQSVPVAAEPAPASSEPAPGTAPAPEDSSPAIAPAQDPSAQS